MNNLKNVTVSQQSQSITVLTTIKITHICVVTEELKSE